MTSDLPKDPSGDDCEDDDLDQENPSRKKDSIPPLTQSEFLLSAGIFEGVLLLIAFVVGWLLAVNPTSQLFWSMEDLVLGGLATVPMLLVLWACYLSRSKGIAAIRLFLRETIGPYLNECRLVDLVLLALLAGVCEEILFRGLLYFWINQYNSLLAVLIANVLFGIAHAVRPCMR